MAAKPISPADHHDPLNDEVSVSQPGPFYGGPFQKADFSHWAKMLVWNWFEIGCLTCGYEPSLLSDLEVEEAKSASPLAYEEVQKRWTLVQREQFAESGTRPMAPLDVLNWLDSIEVDYPSELRDVATRIAKKRLSPVMSAPLGLPNSYQRAIAKSDIMGTINREDAPSPALTRKYRTLQKTALAMAMHRYGFDPTSSRNSAPREIMGATELCGLRVTDDTILAQLREAAEEHDAR